MKKNARILCATMDKTMSAHVMLLQIQCMNLCVKAEPVSLLTCMVKDEDDEFRKIEEVAAVGKRNDYQFEILPFDQKLIPSIVEGMLKIHPEFKQEIVKAEEDCRLNESDTEERHIIYTMPEVDKDRRDVLKDAVKVLYAKCVERMTNDSATIKGRIAKDTEGYSVEDIDELKKTLEEKEKRYFDARDEVRDDKNKEIDEAYERYLKGEQEKEKRAQEAHDASDSSKATSMEMSQEENVPDGNQAANQSETVQTEQKPETPSDASAATPEADDNMFDFLKN